MTEKTFERVLGSVLLVLSTYYCITMFSYPSNAGRIPGIVSLVAIVGLIIQLGLTFRTKSVVSVKEQVTIGEQATQPAQAIGELSSGSNEIEEDSFENLVALRGVRLRRFLLISGFILAYYVGTIFFGFVVMTTVLIPTILLLVRERIWVAIVAGACGALASYLLIVQLLGLSWIPSFWTGG